MGIIKDVCYSASSIVPTKIFSQKSIFPYYHLASELPVDHIKNLYSFKTPEEFENDIILLKKYYKPIDPKILLKEKVTIPPRSFLITFDDGLSEIYSKIAPILEKHKTSAVFLINPNYIDNQYILYKHLISIIIDRLDKQDYSVEIIEDLKQILKVKDEIKIRNTLKSIDYDNRQILYNKIAPLLKIDIQEYLSTVQPYLTKEQIKDLIRRGFYFGGHTISHPPLNKLNFEQQKEEVINSIKWVRDNFNLDYSFFSFPFMDRYLDKPLINVMFEYDSELIAFGNSGIKKDFHPRMIQRFSLEDPSKSSERIIKTENIYSIFNKLIGKYNMKRRG